MATAQHRSAPSTHSGNLSDAERWLSLLAGTGLALRTLRRGGLFGRLVTGAAAYSLISRSATGYCGMKAALQGQLSLKEGMREQWQRASVQLSSATTRRISDMQQLYSTELQELHSAESQLARLLESLGPSIKNPALAVRLDEYASEIRSRKADLDNLLATYHIDSKEHADDAMRALVKETTKMAHMCAPELRDSAVAASVQRIIHYKIAGYGTIAAYAKALGRQEEAARFAGFVDRDRAIDDELTDIAKSALNPEATASVEPGVSTQESGAGLRPH